jgi:hypothetical protein
MLLLIQHENLYKPAFVLLIDEPPIIVSSSQVARNRCRALPRQSFVYGFTQVLVLHQDNHHHVSGFRYGLHEIGDLAGANTRTNRSIDLGFARGVSSDEQS